MNPPFDQRFDPRIGEAVSVGRHVRRLTAPNGGAMTFRGTNTYLLGETSLVVVDPGPDDEAHLAALLRAIEDRPVAAILLTHGHRDHDALAPRLRAAVGAPVLAASNYTGDADGRLADATFLDGAEQRVEVVATPGHTSDHLCFALPASGLVLTGDHVMGWSTTVVQPPDGRMADYMRSLDRLAERIENRYLPGHGGAVEDGQPLLRALRVHRRMRESAIVERLGAGTSDVAALVEALYRDLAPELRPAAAQSVLAHLVDLVERDRVIAPDGVTITGRFRLRPTPPA